MGFAALITAAWVTAPHKQGSGCSPGGRPQAPSRSLGCISHAAKASGGFLEEQKSLHKAIEKAGATFNDAAVVTVGKPGTTKTCLCVHSALPPAHRAGGRAVRNVGDWLTYQHPANEVDAGSATPREARAVALRVRHALGTPTAFVSESVQTNAV